MSQIDQWQEVIGHRQPSGDAEAGGVVEDEGECVVALGEGAGLGRGTQAARAPA